ncbi:MAG: adenosylcobinamide-phosphate synthase, partial [Marinovum sp.]|nr:adenosylcobinamide-phosphate synthase [Marinovum sp.]
VNPHGNRAATPNDIDRTVRMLWITWALMLGFVLLIAVLS